MTVEEVRQRVTDIERLAGDDEAAHSEEDELYHDVLSAIANGDAEDPRRMADEALRSTLIRFARWCA